MTQLLFSDGGDPVGKGEREGKGRRRYTQDWLANSLGGVES